MAEIKIEKKQPVWPWIIVALILLAAAYYFFYYRDHNMEADDMENDTINQIDNDAYNSTESDSTTMYNDTYGNGTKTGPTADYAGFVNDPNMAMDHEYSNKALNLLIGATEDQARKSNVDVKADLDEARKQANAIKSDPKSLDHGDKIKSAAMKISSALKNIQEQNFPMLTSEANNVKDAASKIDATMATMNQKDNMKTFYQNASQLLQKMDAEKATNENQ